MSVPNYEGPNHREKNMMRDIIDTLTRGVEAGGFGLELYESGEIRDGGIEDKEIEKLKEIYGENKDIEYIIAKHWFYDANLKLLVWENENKAEGGLKPIFEGYEGPVLMYRWSKDEDYSDYYKLDEDKSKLRDDLRDY